MSERTDEIIKELGYDIRVKPVTTAPKTPDVVQIRDSFETPAYAVDLLISFIPKDIEQIWECAAGSGRIVRHLLENSGLDIIGSDIRESSYGVLHNFLESGENPEFPYELWETFT